MNVCIEKKTDEYNQENKCNDEYEDKWKVLYEDKYKDECIHGLDDIKSHHNMQSEQYVQRCSCRHADLLSH